MSSSAGSEKKPESRKSSISSVKPDEPTGTPTEEEQIDRPNSVISTVSHAESAALEEKPEPEKTDEVGDDEQETADQTEDKIEVCLAA